MTIHEVWKKKDAMSGEVPEVRIYDIPWVAMDNTSAARDFGWQIEMPLPTILAGRLEKYFSRGDYRAK